MKLPNETNAECASNVTCLMQLLNVSAYAQKAYHETVNFERIVGLVIPSIFAFVIFIGLVGNILVIFVVGKNHQMQNSTNVLILNLAASDLLFLVFCVPFTAANYAETVWHFSRPWCKGMMYLQAVTAYASVWTLVLMAFDRYLAVVFPVQSMTLRSVSNTICVVLLNWFIIIVVNVPNLFEFDIYSYLYIFEKRSICGYTKAVLRTGTELEIRLFYWSFNAFGYMIPLSITLVFYTFMLRKLWFQMPLATFGKRPSQESSRAKRRVTWMVSVVTLVFALCWLPLNICFFITGYKYRLGHAPFLTKAFFIFQVTSQVLAYSNSCLNPILYAFLSENFRKGFYNLIINCPGRKRVDQSRVTSMRFDRTEIRPSSQKENQTYATYQSYLLETRLGPSAENSPNIDDSPDARKRFLADDVTANGAERARRVSWANFDDDCQFAPVEMAKLRQIYD